MDITAVDLGTVLTQLRSRFRDAPAQGAILGRTALRDEVAAFLGCSLLEAEQIVDSLVVRGSVRLVQPPDELAVWDLGDTDRSAPRTGG